ncbi:MAG: alpha/beta hydrolase [Nocardiaceae bacterium]|nr:alpha/beta hydrolase [Nocardiaceae bacterium]
MTALLHDPHIPFTSVEVVTDDGARLHVRTYGSADAPAIVLVHGHGGRVEYWNPQINALASQFRVVVYDQRGFGRSTMGTAGVDTPTLASDLEAVLAEALSAGDRAILVGHSFGGISVLAWAKRFPDHVSTRASAVLLANTIAERFHATSKLVPFAGRAAWIRRPLFRFLGRAQPSVPPNPVVRLVFRLMWVPAAGWRAVDFLLQLSVGVGMRVSSTWTAALSGLKLNEGVANLNVPTTVLVGSRDRATPPLASSRIADILRGTGHLHRFVELEGVGHCPNIETPELFDDEIRRLAAMT